ncbi:hypothetical protein B5S32_g5553 [[Candida] boidinii]|nr:hypothetical protein B5S32_g5553 [[Candida] boidinii]
MKFLTTYPLHIYLICFLIHYEVVESAYLNLDNLIKLLAVKDISIPTIIENISDPGHSYNSEDTVPTVNLIDLLSSSEQYSKFLLSIQRSGLIDYVNNLNNITLLAPVNQAFDDKIDYVKIDMNQFNRYIVDIPLLSNEIIGVQIYNTLNLNSSSLIKKIYSPILMDNELKTNESLIINNNNINNNINKDKIDKDDKFTIGTADVLFSDLISINQDSVMYGISDFLYQEFQTCSFFEEYSKEHKDIKPFTIFSNLISNDQFCFNNDLTNITFLIPFNDFIPFNEIEINYLKLSVGYDDKKQFLSNFMIPGIIGGNFLNKTLNFETLNKNSINISSDFNGHELIVNNKIKTEMANYLTTDGSLQFFNSLIYDKEDYDKILPIFTPRKYLHGLNETMYVEEIDYRSLSELIDNKEIKQTILVYPDPDSDLILTNNNNNNHEEENQDIISYGTAKNNILYHFINENNIDFNIDQLVYTKHCNNAVLGSKNCQRLKITRSKKNENKIILNDNIELFKDEKYTIGNSDIFFINDHLSIPTNLESSLTAFSKCTKTLEFLNLFQLLKFKPNDNKGYTVFLPTTSSWNELDLTLEYLINNEQVLFEVIKNFVINGLIYDDFQGIDETFTNINDDIITISKIENNSTINENSSNGEEEGEGGDENTLIKLNNSVIPIDLKNEVLFNGGVAHCIKEVYFPDDLVITTKDIISSLNNEEFIKIINFFGMDKIFEPTMNYSIILPSAKSLLMENISSSMSDLRFLEEFIKLHILPGEDSLNKLMNCEDEIPTLLNGTHLSCRELSSGDFMLQIKEGSDHEVRILRKGFTTGGRNEDSNSNSNLNSIKNGVFLIDRPISPNWLDNHDSIHLHLPILAVLIGVIIGMVVLFLVVSCCLVATVGVKSKKLNQDSNTDNNTDNTDNNNNNNSDMINVIVTDEIQSNHSSINKNGVISNKSVKSFHRGVGGVDSETVPLLDPNRRLLNTGYNNNNNNNNNQDQESAISRNTGDTIIDENIGQIKKYDGINDDDESESPNGLKFSDANYSTHSSTKPIAMQFPNDNTMSTF